MARFNEILVGRYNRFIQKLMSMKGAATLVTISDEALVNLNLFSGVENRYLESWDRFGATTGAVASLANQSATRLRNPVGSNVIAVIEKLAVSVGSGTIVNAYLGATAADLVSGAPLTAARLDARSRPQPTLIATNQNTTPVAPTFGSEFAQPTPAPIANPYDFILTENQELTVLPGDAIELVAATVNVQLVVFWIWRERFLEESERA